MAIQASLLPIQASLLPIQESDGDPSDFDAYPRK